jgi:hypothetical protein
MLSEPGASFIVATGHFSREAMTSVYIPRIIPKTIATVIAKPGLEGGPRGLRLKLQLGEIMRGIRHVREGDVDIVEVGEASVVGALRRHLRRPNTAVVIAVDAHAPSKAGAYQRPFAGHAVQNFALGTAMLSRLTQRPILPCVSYLDEAGRVVIEWSAPIAAPARTDPEADERITSAILDIFEHAVGLRPGQYVQPIGEGRVWNAAAEQWRDPQRISSTSTWSSGAGSARSSGLGGVKRAVGSASTGPRASAPPRSMRGWISWPPSPNT